MRGAKELIDEAMEGVSIAICRRCQGFGVVGLASLEATCPGCDGSGRTTINEAEHVPSH